jgi:hypothetical protein
LHYIFGTMLSEIIKKKIEQKAGQRIRYSRDCDTLAEKILSDCKCSISSSTLKRLFGFVKGEKEPRAYTLDILAAYIGYPSWDELLHSFNTEGSQARREISELKPSKLKPGEKFELSYKPNTIITIEHIGKSKFKVLAVKNSRLKEGNVFKAAVITLHHPLFVLEVEGDAGKEGKMIEGKISGITSIKKL